MKTALTRPAHSPSRSTAVLVLLHIAASGLWGCTSKAGGQRSELYDIFGENDTEHEGEHHSPSADTDDENPGYDTDDEDVGPDNDQDDSVAIDDDAGSPEGRDGSNEEEGDDQGQDERLRVPGKIEAEAYHDFKDSTDGNEGGQYRYDDVDIEACSEGGYNVGWTEAGEFLRYNIVVEQSGTYTITVRAASVPGGAFRIDVGASEAVARTNVDPTGGWQSFVNVSKTVDLSQGKTTMTVHILVGGLNFNYFSITKGGATPNDNNDDGMDDDIIDGDNGDTPDHPGGDWTLVWSDEFDGSGLPDSSKWGYDVGGGGWGNGESQYYTESRTENARQEKGVLIIEARRESVGGRNYTSARLVTKNKGDWLYGRMEIRARLPEGRGTWPAIWMLPTVWEYGGWPDSGEIDIMEHVGYNPGVVHGTVHTKAYNHTIGTQQGAQVSVPDAMEAFHTYTIEWSPSQIDWYMDDNHYYTFRNENAGSSKWPFDKRFHLILNIAIGGAWGGVQGIDDAIFPQRMEVDYVRVYQ